MAMIRNITPRLVERGKIKIGMKGDVRKSSGGGEYQLPVKLDHFVVTTLDRDETNNFAPDQHAISLYGEKPTSLPIRLLFDDPAKNFSSRYACYVGEKAWCTGDGVEAIRQMSNGPTKISCPCERIRPDYQATKAAPACKFNGALSVMLDGMPGVGGVWGFRTTSYNSVVNIMSALAQIQLVTGGPLAGIPLNLVLHSKRVASPSDGKLQTVFVVSIEYAGTIDELQELGLARLRKQIDHRIEIRNLEDKAARLLLPSPEQGGTFDGETAADVVEEFYPETIDRETGEVTKGGFAGIKEAVDGNAAVPAPATAAVDVAAVVAGLPSLRNARGGLVVGNVAAWAMAADKAMGDLHQDHAACDAVWEALRADAEKLRKSEAVIADAAAGGSVDSLFRSVEDRVAARERRPLPI